MVKVIEMFFRIFFFCSMLVFCSFPALAGEAEARVVLNMNTGWAFHRGEVESGGQPGLDDSGWIAAIIPHIMMESGGIDVLSEYRHNTKTNK